MAKKQQQPFPYQHLAVLGLDGAQKYVPPSTRGDQVKAPTSGRRPPSAPLPPAQPPAKQPPQ